MGHPLYRRLQPHHRAGPELACRFRIVAHQRDHSAGRSDLDGSDQAVVQNLSCADCSVSAQVINFSAGVAELDLRQQSSNDRYDVALLANGNLQIRRHNGATVTVLGEAPSGIPDLGWWATIALSATGSNPVNLVASVDGVTKVEVNDSSPSAIRVAGTAGIWTDLRGDGAAIGSDARIDHGQDHAGNEERGGASQCQCARPYVVRRHLVQRDRWPLQPAVRLLRQRRGHRQLVAQRDQPAGELQCALSCSTPTP